jgi:hypothetical protein
MIRPSRCDSAGYRKSQSGFQPCLLAGLALATGADVNLKPVLLGGGVKHAGEMATKPFTIVMAGQTQCAPDPAVNGRSIQKYRDHNDSRARRQRMSDRAGPLQLRRCLASGRRAGCPNPAGMQILAEGKMPRLQRVGIVQCYLGGYRTKPGFALTFHLSFERDVVKSVRTGSVGGIND